MRRANPAAAPTRRSTPIRRPNRDLADGDITVESRALKMRFDSLAIKPRKPRPTCNGVSGLQPFPNDEQALKRAARYAAEVMVQTHAPGRCASSTRRHVHRGSTEQPGSPMDYSKKLAMEWRNLFYPDGFPRSGQRGSTKTTSVDLSCRQWLSHSIVDRQLVHQNPYIGGTHGFAFHFLHNGTQVRRITNNEVACTPSIPKGRRLRDGERRQQPR